MVHRIDEIKRRLSVLEKRLDLTNSTSREEPLTSEITRRLDVIKNTINEKPTDGTLLTELDVTKILQTLEEYESLLQITGNINPDAPPRKEQRELKYEVNFHKSEFGNAIRTGQKMLIRVAGAESVSAGIYKNGNLILAKQSSKRDEDKNTETVSFLLKRRRRTRLGIKINLDLGTYLLHTWFWNEKTGKQGTYKDEFEITP